MFHAVTDFYRAMAKLFNDILNADQTLKVNQTIALMYVGLMVTLLSWWIIVVQVNKNNEKAFRKSAYKKKNFFAKLFLRGLEHLVSKFNIVMNYIDKIIAIIFILFCILNIVFGLPIFSDMIMITGLMLFISFVIIAIDNK